jgi:hypothetical protein
LCNLIYFVIQKPNVTSTSTDPQLFDDEFDPRAAESASDFGEFYSVTSQAPLDATAQSSQDDFADFHSAFSQPQPASQPASNTSPIKSG